MARILLVDHDDESRDALARQFMRRGFDVRAVEHGKTCLELAGREFPDVVLLDMTLPEVDACEVARRLKGDERNSAIPIVAMVDGEKDNEGKKALEAGCADYVTIPVDFKALMEKVIGLLAK